MFKTVVYTAVAFLVRILEKIVGYWLGGGTMNGIPDCVAHPFSWHWHAAVQIWIFVLFTPYTSATDLDERLGRGELARMFFNQRSPGPASS